MPVKPSSVVVALSGGVDSSLAAVLLKDSGWHVTGLHLELPAAAPKKRNRRRDVERLSDFLKIPVVFLCLEEAFRKRVVEPFAAAYQKGLTPNPCVVCNQAVKFAELFHYAGVHGADYVATGHYVRLEGRGTGAAALCRGRDRGKEQSYFLHRLQRSRLDRILFPLGEMTKEETRRSAAARGLPARTEPESQEVCFIPDNDYRPFVERLAGPGAGKAGDILDRNGRKLGEHLGTHRYTIGQRHGLGIASARPYYVREIRPERNEILVARREELFSREVRAEAFNWLVEPPPDSGEVVAAQIRYRHRAARARIEILPSGRVRLEFEAPQWAVTPGQALVCYREERLLGGGWITGAGAA